MTSTFITTPRVAVCLAAHDGMAWLSDQVASILSQEGVAVVLYVSVDASADGTEAWFDRLAEIDPRIRILPHGVRFGGAAGNFFRLLREVNFVDCDYLAFADQDDLWFSGKLCRAIKMLLENKADAYSSDVIAFWPDGREQLVQKSQPQKSWDFLFESPGPGCTHVISCALAQEIQAVLRKDPAATQNIRFHDWFVYAFARTRALNWYIDAQPGLRYRQHAANQLGVNSGYQAIWRRARKLFSGDHIDQARQIVRAAGALDLPFVRLTLLRGRTGLLKLALQAGRCRRRRRDQWVFALACLWLALRGR